jgi:hypothetical protein
MKKLIALGSTLLTASWPVPAQHAFDMLQHHLVVVKPAHCEVGCYQHCAQSPGSPGAATSNANSSCGTLPAGRCLSLASCLLVREYKVRGVHALCEYMMPRVHSITPASQASSLLHCCQLDSTRGAAAVNSAVFPHWCTQCCTHVMHKELWQMCVSTLYYTGSTAVHVVSRINLGFHALRLDFST